MGFQSQRPIPLATSGDRYSPIASEISLVSTKSAGNSFKGTRVSVTGQKRAGIEMFDQPDMKSILVSFRKLWSFTATPQWIQDLMSE